MNEVDESAGFFSSYGFRRGLVVSIVGIVFVAIMARAAYLQVVIEDKLKNEAKLRHERLIEVPGKRGEITDRYGHLLAYSTPIYDFWLDPQHFLRQFEVEESEALANPSAIYSLDERFLDKKAYFRALGIVSQLAKIESAELEEKIRDFSRKRYMSIQLGITPQAKAHNEAMLATYDLNYLYFRERYRRYFPAGEVVSHVVGFTDFEDRGQNGLELTLDNVLKGKPGTAEVLRSRKHAVVEWGATRKAAKVGENIALSLDLRLQFAAYQALKNAISKHQAKAGGLVLADARSGEILALASAPGYNPNKIEQRLPHLTRNRVFTDLIAPGSTVKPFVIAAALDLGKTTLDDVIHADNAYLDVDGFLVNDPRAYGEMTLTDILKKSSNVGSATLALRMTAEELWRYYDFIGFQRRTDIGFPAETDGRMKLPYEWNRIDLATAGYGYGYGVSLMQLLKSFLILANHGVSIPVTLFKQDENHQPVGELVFAPEVADAVVAMMHSVTKQGGTGTQAALTGYSVAGKTGTTFKTRGDSIDQNTYATLFAGMLPAKDPQLVMLVWVDEPSRGEYHGGTVAAPVFKQVMSEAVRILHIPPDDLLPAQTNTGQTP